MQEVLLFATPGKRQVWENTFNSNGFHVYSFHPLKDLIKSDNAIELIKDNKVDIAFMDIASLSDKTEEGREVYINSIQEIAQQCATDKFTRLALYLPENLTIDIAQLVKTVFAFQVYDFFQPHNRQFQIDCLDKQLHKPKNIENGTKFFTLASQVTEAPAVDNPENDIFTDDIKDENDDNSDFQDVMAQLKKVMGDDSSSSSKQDENKSNVSDKEQVGIKDSSNEKEPEKDTEDANEDTADSSQQSSKPESENQDQDEKEEQQEVKPYDKQWEEPPRRKKHLLKRQKRKHEEEPEEENPNGFNVFDDDSLLKDDEAAQPEVKLQEIEEKPKQRPKKKKKAKSKKSKVREKKSKTPIILIILVVGIILLGIIYVGLHGINTSSSPASSTSTSISKLLDEGNFAKAAEDYPSQQTKIDNYILNDDDINDKGKAINQVYTNAESPNDTVVFDNAYFQKDWNTVIANKSGTDLTMQRKTMLCISYLATGDVDNAQKYANEVNYKPLTDKVKTYKQYQETNQQIQNKLKDNNLSQDDRNQLQKQLSNNKKAMKEIVNE